MGKVVVDILKFGLDLGHQLVGLVLVKLKNALHLYLHQSEDVVACHLTHKVLGEGCQLLVDKRHSHIHVGGVFEAALLIDALLYEDALQRSEEQLLKQLATTDLQLLAQEAHGAVYVVTQHIAHRQEARFVVLDDAAVGRQVNLTVGEGIEGVNGLV